MMIDVLVIGAGFAGMTAARELSAAGLSVLMLEARDRVGGRTWRNAYGTHMLELGGAYVHWSQPHVWAELTRYGLRVAPDSSEDIAEMRLLSDGRLHCLSGDDGYALLGEAYAALYAADPQPADLFPLPYDPLSHLEWQAHAEISLAQQLERLALPSLQHDALRAMLRTDMSAQIETAALIEVLRQRALLGSGDFTRLAEVNGTYLIEGGTAALLEQMRADTHAELRTGQVVTAIEQADERVSVRCADGSVYIARAAVVALALNTWSSITFVPALNAAKQTLAEQKHAGSGFKCFVRVAGQQPALLAIAPPPQAFSLLTTSHTDGDSTWLVGFGVEAPAAFTVEWSQSALAPLFPNVHVLEVVGHNWTADPFSRGTWATLRPGQATLLQDAIRPEGRLHFASGDIALGWRGYIDGAIESGLRAAREVRAQVRGERA
ncbi:MAG: NAD(P)/FAD-dependent oxidoreductase [Chloroflexota bacterium]|nr:NAD(P)/FAD-dependent oxidoreductase [Chloroflexota bacterium]